uniref:Uncharacterized protein n=1 Tax=Anguilla anguilla TaxID=7936 RepID=A0A0E9S8Z9_ANGAN
MEQLIRPCSRGQDPRGVQVQA